MGVEFDFSDVDAFFQQGESEVVAKVSEIGEESVQYAKDNGTYKDRTGTLRQANDSEADITGLTLKNEAEYASFVEAKGFEVLSSAALYAEKRLKEELG